MGCELRCSRCRPTASWHLRRVDVRNAVRMSGSSAPGPDGIPYRAWRRLGPLGIDVLFAAVQTLGQDDALPLLLEAWPADSNHNTGFNEATMVSAPKTNPQEFQNIE